MVSPKENSRSGRSDASSESAEQPGLVGSSAEGLSISNQFTQAHSRTVALPEYRRRPQQTRTGRLRTQGFANYPLPPLNLTNAAQRTAANTWNGKNNGRHIS